MRLFPDSLFGRLVVVLSVGLTLALVSSAAINLRERHHILEHAGVERFAQRLATMARLADGLAPAERHSLAQVMHRVSITPAAPVGGSRLPPHLAQLDRALVSDLGPGYPVRLVMLPPPLDRDGDHDNTGLDNPPPAFAIGIGLHDGSWLTIVGHHPPPPPGETKPYALLVKLGILLFVALLLSFLAVTWVTRPLGMLASAADALGRDIRRPPLPEKGPAEVRRAAGAFNRMQQHLVGFLDGRLRMLTAISHDLKTPVTRLRLRAELLGDPAQRDAVNRDLDEMDALLGTALDYLRGELEVEPLQQIDVNALVGSLAADSQDLGQPVSVEGAAAKPYRGRPRALRRCLDNLVQNALRYGKVAEIRVDEAPGALVVRVRDRGPGLPEQELERVFEPFYRSEASRNRATGGTGLGLAIARGVAQAHGGSLKLANRAEGGLEATLTLPR